MFQHSSDMGHYLADMLSRFNEYKICLGVCYKLYMPVFLDILTYSDQTDFMNCNPL